MAYWSLRLREAIGQYLGRECVKGDSREFYNEGADVFRRAMMFNSYMRNFSNGQSKCASSSLFSGFDK